MQPLFTMIFLALRWHDVLDLINLSTYAFCISYFEFIEHVKTVMPTIYRAHEWTHFTKFHTGNYLLFVKCKVSRPMVLIWRVWNILFWSRSDDGLVWQASRAHVGRQEPRTEAR